MREINDIYEFGGSKYLLIEDNIVEEKNKMRIILFLNLLAILILVTGFIVTSLVIGTEYSISLSGSEDILAFLITIVIVLLSFFVFIIVHELLHGWAFRIFNKNTKDQIKFGLVIKSGMAYCISTIPVKLNAARLSLMMPVYVICIPVFILAIILNNPWIGLLAFYFFSGSAGDLYYMWKLRKTNKKYYMFEEMPTKTGYEVGYLLFEKVE